MSLAQQSTVTATIPNWFLPKLEKRKGNTIPKVSPCQHCINVIHEDNAALYMAAMNQKSISFWKMSICACLPRPCHVMIINHTACY